VERLVRDEISRATGDISVNGMHLLLRR
jgi:hypothetical protein